MLSLLRQKRKEISFQLVYYTIMNNEWFANKIITTNKFIEKTNSNFS